MVEELTSKLKGRRVIVVSKNSHEKELIEYDVNLLKIVPNKYLEATHNDKLKLEAHLVFVGYLEGIYQIRDFNSQNLIYENQAVIKAYNNRFIEDEEMQDIADKGKWNLENIN